MDTTRSGFTILQFRKLNNWKILDVGNHIPFTTAPHCPNDMSLLKTLCTLIGNNGTQRIRIGCCENCGTIGYIDRPTQEWFTAFYADTWDQRAASQREGLIKHEIVARRQQYEQERDKCTLTSKAIHKILPQLDKKRPILEIGCGYGLNLKRLKDAGFENLTGIEASVHRAEVTRRLFDISVHTGNFEDNDMQSSLKNQGAFGLIYSHHVLEHIYNPEEVIKLSASLQKEGDRFIVTLPNFEGEISLGALLFLPHLHSFTKQGLQNLLTRFGYTVIDDSFTTPYELCLIAEKRSLPVIHNESGHSHYFANALKKFTTYFSFPMSITKSRRIFWCSRDIDKAGYLPFLGNTVLTRSEEILMSRTMTMRYKKDLQLAAGYPIYDWRGIISLVVAPLQTRYTSYHDSPLEIQFKENIKLSYK